MSDDFTAELLRRMAVRAAVVRPAIGVARWAASLAAQSRPLVAVDFGIDLMQRRRLPAVANDWSNEQATRLERRTYGQTETRMDVSPYVPPQRQVSVARQGAPEWEVAAPVADFSPEARARLVGSRDMDSIRRDLEALGWKLT